MGNPHIWGWVGRWGRSRGGKGGVRVGGGDGGGRGDGGGGGEERGGKGEEGWRRWQREDIEKVI